jgi:hypothetical protein
MNDVCGFNQANIDDHYAMYDDPFDDDFQYDFDEENIRSIFDKTKNYGATRMSRYLLLLLINTPLILLSMLGALTRFKLHKSTKLRFFIQIISWILVFVGLASAETIYTWLFQNNLTQTEPLSLFDVIQITAIVVVYYIANRSYAKVEALEKRVQDLHQELSIKLSKNGYK